MTSATPKSIVLCGYQRTGFGSLGGSLKQFTATDLAVHASEALMKKTPLKIAEVDAIIFGNVCQSSSNAIYFARHVGLRVGLGIDKPALTVNRLCGSGFEAIVQGAYQILLEGARCVLVGGSESMSQTPYVLRQARFGYRLGHGILEDYLTASLTDEYVQMPMAITAERIGARFKISRSEVDEYSLQSQQRYQKAKKDNVFADEITAMEIPSKKTPVVFAHDEHPRAQSNIESLSRLPSLFQKEGLVTAGTASGICDGAAALLVAEESWARSQGLPILARVLSWAAVGCAPEEMGMGPVGAIRRVIERMPPEKKIRSAGDFKLVEINEAFAAQYLGVEKELALDRARTNIHGGAIAMGHPLAASGARLTGHLALSLAKAGGGIGVASACIGGGQGMAIALEG